MCTKRSRRTSPPLAIRCAVGRCVSRSRVQPWPRVHQFLSSLAPGAIVADVGCGNGKYLGVNPQLAMLGSDRSHNLVAICRDRGFEAMVCDTMRVPYRSAAFDAAISIAVIHHLSTEEHRVRALKELLRIVRVGGEVLVYVWALEQTENTFFHQVRKSSLLVNLCIWLLGCIVYVGRVACFFLFVFRTAVRRIMERRTCSCHGT